MSQEAERLHRQDPARDGPNRDFSAYARSYGMGGRPHGAEDPVAQGVKLGYSVLDEQMREGRRLAERLRGGMRPGAAAPEFGALIERALNIYRDMGALAFAAAEALAGGSGLRAGKPEAAPAGGAAALCARRQILPPRDREARPARVRAGAAVRSVAGAGRCKAD